jgi:hypothetical protein
LPNILIKSGQIWLQILLFSVLGKIRIYTSYGASIDRDDLACVELPRYLVVVLAGCPPA